MATTNLDTNALAGQTPPSPGVGPSRARETERRAVHLVALAFALIALWALRSLWVPLILASWFALVARPAQQWLATRMGGHRRAASLVTFLLVVFGMLPIAVTILSLAGDAIVLVKQIGASPDAHQALQTLVAGPNASGADAGAAINFDSARLMDLARRHGLGALQTLTRIAGALTTAIIGIVVFVYGFYVFLQHSPKIHRWLGERAPVPRVYFERLTAAYAETGRGLLIGVGLTALLQGAVMTVGYVLVDIPHALILGLLTAVASILPALGSALVWVPVALALALSGRMGHAAIIMGLGLFVGVADNFVRPVLSRYGRLKLPVFLLFVAMLGGIAWLGTWGLVIGPLVVRLAVEALEVMRDELGREQHEPASAGVRFLDRDDRDS